MKNTYVKPEMQVEEFLANQYVAACGKRDGKYIFTCDAPAGNMYVKINGKSYILNGTYGQHSFSPCGKQHETDGPSGYYDGFIDRNYNGQEDSGESALLWLEGYSFSRGTAKASNGHASASLTREQIEVERS